MDDTDPRGSRRVLVGSRSLRLPLVLPDPAAYGPRWRDLAFDRAPHRVIHFLPTRAAAEAWFEGSPP